MLVAPKITTKRTVLTLLQHYDYQLLIDYYERNSSHLLPWEPERDNDYLEASHVSKRLQVSNDLFFAGGAVNFVARGNIKDGKVSADHNGQILGVCNFANTNQYKDLIAQREFSGPEARQRVKSIVILRSSSLTQHQHR
ncbi:GNAT family protein [Shewanella woodyi]|uniref:hypothetical protein n=1 Tax=Shewanella woodyi TaxID=60961 RepID=UPI0000E752A5|nr:hypothetical protein [Shewanella woodyi]